MIDGLGRLFVRGVEDDELLGVCGEFERLAEQLKLVPGWVIEPESPSSRHHVAVQAAGEVGAGDGGEFGGEPREVLDGWCEPQVEGLFVRDVVPVGEERPGAGVGEDVAGEVRGGGVEQSGSAGDRLVAAGVGEDVAQPVGHDGDARFKEAECLQDGRSHLSGRWCGPGVGGTFVAGDLREVAQVVALRGGEAERIGERVDDRCRWIAVAALLDAGQIFEADAAPRGEIQAA